MKLQFNKNYRIFCSLTKEEQVKDQRYIQSVTIMASISIAVFACMLVVAAMTAAYPMRKYKESMTDEDLIKTIRYLWNEEMGKEQDGGRNSENLRLRAREKDENKKEYESRDGDREGKVAMDLWKIERDEDKDRFKILIDTGC